MSSTPILGITEVAPNQNNKEVTINDGFLTLEQAMNATLAVNLTSGSATIVTADFQHNFVFKCSGNTVARDLVVPNQARFYAVWNTGTSTITVKTASPATTASVAASALCIIASDGANNQKVISDSSVAGFGSPEFVNLTDVPASYTGASKKVVRVNAGETALEFHAEAMSDLADVAAFTPLYFARVKADGSGIEWVSSAGSTVSTFIAMTDAPGSYSGAGGKVLRVNAGATAVEFDAKNTIFALTDLTNCPSSLTGQADKVLAVKGDETGMQFVNLPSVGSVITLATGDPNASFAAGTLSPWNIDVGSGASNFVANISGILSPYSGAAFLYSATHTGEAQEQISRIWDLTTLATATELDNNSYIQLGYAFAPQNADTTGLVTVQPMSATSVPIGSPFSTGSIAGTVNTWAANSLTCNLPTGTRKIKIVVQTNSGGANIAGVWDNLDFTTTVIQDAAFINLSDAPSSYTSAAKKVVRVNAGATGVEFHTPAFLDLADVPTSYTGQAHLALRVNVGETGLEFFSVGGATLATLSDVNVTEGAGIDGHVLTWDEGTLRWVADAVSAGSLATLSDATISTPTDKQILAYDTSASKWENKDRNPVNTQTGDYTLLLADAWSTVRMNKATAITATVPPNATSAFPIGTKVIVTQAGAGVLTIAAGAGVTINATGGTLVFSSQWQQGLLTKTATNTWDLQIFGSGGGSSTLAADTDVGITSAVQGNYLRYDLASTQWKNWSWQVTSHSADYTFVLADAESTVELTGATGHSFTIPPNASVAFPVGTSIECIQAGAGVVTIAPGAGVTLDGSPVASSAQYQRVLLRKVATNEWNCIVVPSSGGGSSTLASDTDVSITTPANGDVLTYNSGAAKWENSPSAGPSAGSPPTIVQTGATTAGSVSGITLGSAPVSGNLLVAYVTSPSSLTAGTGWTILTNNSSGTDFSYWITKTAGGSESATQNPISSSPATAAIMMWELHGQAASPVVASDPGSPVTAAFVTSLAFPGVTNVLAIACGVITGSSNTITAMYNYTQDQLINSGTRRLVGGHANGSHALAQMLTTFNGTAVGGKSGGMLVTS